MKIKIEEEKDEVLLTINFADYTMSLAPPCSLPSSSTSATTPGSPATPTSASLGAMSSSTGLSTRCPGWMWSRTSGGS